MSDNYVIYHLHTMLSNGVTNIDSITSFSQYVDKFKHEYGMTAIGCSEHGNVFSWLKKKEAAEKAGMKYLHGCEVYITENPEEKIRDNYHCLLIARNYDGVLELHKLVSHSFNRAEVKTVGEETMFYYMPRISFEELLNTSDNIIITTACLASILNNASDMMKERFICFLAANKHRCFLEIQHHNVEEQKEYNKFLYTLSKTIDVPLIAGTDTHALNELHMQGRAILQRSKKVHFDNESSWNLVAMSRKELEAAYELQNALPQDVYEWAIDNTNVLADMVEEFAVDHSYKYPHLWENPLATFREKINKGIKWRGVDKYDNYQEYLDRIEYEIEAYVHNDAIDFMLLMEDIISWCRSQDIMVGYGRGSVNGSVIAWLLGITEMDSIKFHLNFERFMNVERVSLSDIDTDFPPSRIEDVKQYIFSKHGLYCSDIITFNTISDKGAIKDVARALGIPLDEAQQIANSVDNEEKYAESRKKYPELFKWVDLVKGTVVSIGSHPCGTIVSPETLEDHIGLCTTSTSKYPISQLYMKEVDSLNYVKLDLLKLDTIELIDRTCKLAGIERITPDNIDVDDIKVWNAIRDDTTQIFQWEGTTGDKYIKKLLSDENIKKLQSVNHNIDRMTLLSIGNSAIRPAGASYREDLANGVIRTTGSKPIDDFLSNTFGYLVFQCQIIDFLHLYCGFTMGEADVVRRGFAKKTGTEQYIPIIKDGGCINTETGHHIDGYVKTMKYKYGIDEQKSEEDIAAFIQVIEDASSYLFSLNHSQPYSLEGYVSGWLRTYYPLEFLTVAMNINRDKEEKTLALTEYAKKIGIKFHAPQFKYSRGDYFCDKETNTIYKGTESIKFLNETVSNELVELSQNDYSDFVDLLFDLKEKTSINSRQLDILIKIDFFKDFGDINTLLWITQEFDELYGKKSIKKDSPFVSLIGEETLRRFCDSETKTHIDEIDIVKFMDYKGIAPEDVGYELSDCIKFKNMVVTREDIIILGNKLPPDVQPGDRVRIPNGYSYKKIFKKYNITEDELKYFAKKIVYGKFDGIHKRHLLKYLLKKSKYPPCSIQQKIKYQQEHLGYVDYTDETIDKRYIVIMGLDTKYSPKFTAYCLNNGTSSEMKVRRRKNPNDKRDIRVKTTFNKSPFNDGDILYIKSCGKEPKMRKTEDGWEADYSSMVWWLYDWDVVTKL